MQVDNALPSQYSLNSTFEDFFNMELFGSSLNQQSQSTGATSPSRSSSTSPSGSFSGLPPTPPHNADSFYNFYLEDELVKSDPLISYPPSSSFDFFGALSNNNRYSTSSQSGSGSSPDDVATPSTVLSIDPQLVDSPSAPNPHSDVNEVEPHNQPDHVDNSHPAPEEPIQIPPYKVGGKGKSGRKGTVQSGGVVKKTSALKERALSSPLSPSDDLSNNDWDDGRPPPEEYKKLSSKEKRQLRNKISARNFRVRRKEYITALESDIAERDRLIDAIRGELGSTKSENSALRQEIDALKKSLLAAEPSPVLPPPAPLPTLSAAASVAARNTTMPSSPLLAPNTNKDLPSSPRLASSRGGFWGGQGSNPFGATGGFTPVHTTLVPEWSISGALAGKGLVTPPDSPPLDLPSRVLQENLNPALNKTHKSTIKQQPECNNLQSTTMFDSFTDANPFTMKTLEMYRMQLWTRLAHQQVVQRQQKQADSQSPALTGLAANLRPHYFTAAGKQPLASSSISTLLSDKGTAGSYPTPPSSPLASELPMRATAQEAALASLASQTLLSKLGSAFWDAFAGQNESVPSSSRKGLDANKVRMVLEGKAVLKVVDVDEQVSSRSLSSMKVPQSSAKLSPPTTPKPTTTLAEQIERCREKCSVSEILEESMKSLSISKRGNY